MSEYIDMVRGLSVFQSFQWSKRYPSFAKAKKLVVESEQEGVCNTIIIPLSVSADETEKRNGFVS